MGKRGNPDLKKHAFKVKTEPMPKQVNIRVSEETFDFIRSLPDGVEFIRQAITEKRQRMLNSDDIYAEDEFLNTPVEENNSGNNIPL
jgi:hypothetical protein